MRQVYNLNLEAVLSVLARHQLSGTLSASLPNNKILKEPSQIEMSIDRGKLQSCVLRSGQSVLSKEEAVKVIVQLGVIPWVFEPVQTHTSRLPQPSESSPVPHPGYSGIYQFSPSQTLFLTRVPRKVAVLSSADLSRLPRPHFQVYAHINGRYTVAEIAQLLKTTPGGIESILRELQAWQLISLN